jgi:hypothetical protein
MVSPRFWRSYNDQTLLAEQQAAQLASLRAAYAADVATLEKLERTNVYNDAFCIGHDGVFGTINGLRLGRVPGVPVSRIYLILNLIMTGQFKVDWAEINAAWGQTLLLLYTIARKLDYTFDQYVLPMPLFINCINLGQATGSFPWARFLASKKLPETKPLMNFMVPVICTLDACSTTGDSILQWLHF